MLPKIIGPILLLAALLIFNIPLHAQEKGRLGPGWLSLDGCVGLLDIRVQQGKSTLEKALGIGISGFLDTS
jgi:hypothetical protein